MRIAILVACLWLATSPLWSKIVFYSFRDGQTEIYTMDSDGANQTRLTFNEASDAAPAWSPNGEQIVFRSYQDGNAEVYVMDADGKNPRNLTRQPASDTFPDWSPDGSQIAFGSRRDRNGRNIFVMDADGRNVRKVTRMRFASRPKWSPNGKRILFEAVTDSGREVYMVDADGRNLWKVSFQNFRAGMFARGWSPDGKRVLFTEAIGHSVNDATLIIATLHPTKREVIYFDRVPLPKMSLHGGAWGADGKSILITTRPADGPKDFDWNIYRFHLTDKKLTQLTHHAKRDQIGQEWNFRLSVPQQRLLPYAGARLNLTDYNIEEKLRCQRPTAIIELQEQRYTSMVHG